MGKIPVNLNYTLSPEAISSCLEQCGITDLIVSGKLIDRLKLELPVTLHRLEDLAVKPTLVEKAHALTLAKFTSSSKLLQKLGGASAQPEDLATIIFSSGSTGAPKGVMLSHRNIIVNVQQVSEVYQFTPSDRMLGVLPFFHSFGFMATISGPAVIGFGAIFHFNPIETKVIAPLAEKNQITLMIATPTFLQFYLRGIKSEQLAKLRLVIVGAEKLPDRTAEAFEKKFSCRPVEAYGCTECSPGIAVSDPQNTRPGSIGRPLRDVEVRIIHPETGETLPNNTPGLLLVKGPNVMKGYLAQAQKTAEVLKDGWYHTGDIVRQDEEGYLWIEGRLSRFSKIGGEMVPHGNVEDCLNSLAQQESQIFAVTGIPDDKKGERLIVIHTANNELLEEVIQKLSSAPIPNLWKPKSDQFLSVPKLPYLGSGKLDLKALQEIALAR